MTPNSGATLVLPAQEYLSSYAEALHRGWSPNTLRPEAGAEELYAISADSNAFLAGLVDKIGRGPPIRLPDGSTVARLPGYQKWIWDGEFCGNIGLRWSPGTSDLPATCPGHIGYSVVPWKQRRGHASEALRQLLIEARELGLDHVILTTDPANEPSQRVVLRNKGVLLGRFRRSVQLGSGDELRFRIDLL
jgi:predicted acetyltransferase